MAWSAFARLVADTWGMHDVGAGWWILMLALMILFWGLVVAGVLWLVRGAAASRGPFASPSPTETPQDVLDRRLAAGEITPDEYEQRRRLLRESLRSRDQGKKETFPP